MAMYKAAQVATSDELVITFPIETESFEPNSADEIVLQPEELTETEVEMPVKDEKEICFTLPFLPGAPDEVVEISDENTESDEDKKESDKSKAADQPKDLNWIKDYLDKIPRHKGETLGLERAKSYLNRGSNILSKMIQEDHDGKIDISNAEDARIEIENGIDRLDKELNKRKKKAQSDSNLTKEGQKAAGIGTGGVIVTVPLIVSSIARVCINSTISGGKDIEDTFQRLSKKYKLTDREKVEVIQLLNDMNFPMRRDRGFMVDDDEKYGYSSENNYDLPPNYYA